MKMYHSLFFFIVLNSLSQSLAGAEPHNPFDFSDHEEEGSIITMQGTIPTIINQYSVHGSFTGSNLLSLCIKNSQLLCCNFQHSGLTYARVEDSSLNNSTFQGTEMPTSRFSNSSFSHCAFSRANLFEVEIGNNCDLTEASFTNSDISYGSLVNSTAERATFTECDFSHSELSALNLTNSSFINCRFSRAHLNNLDFSHTIMRKPRFFKATLTNVTFAHSTTLQQADFRQAKLSQVNFDETDLRGMRFTGVRILEGTSFRNAKIDETTEATPEEIASLIELGAIMVSENKDLHTAKRPRLKNARP